MVYSQLGGVHTKEFTSIMAYYQLGGTHIKEFTFHNGIFPAGVIFILRSILS